MYTCTGNSFTLMTWNEDNDKCLGDPKVTWEDNEGTDNAEDPTKPSNNEGSAPTDSTDDGSAHGLVLFSLIDKFVLIASASFVMFIAV